MSLGKNTAWQRHATLGFDTLNVERNYMHTVIPREPGLRELGRAISEDADVGHGWLWAGHTAPRPDIGSFN